MGCVVSSEGDDDCRRRIIGVSAAAVSHHHHIVSLTSSTYGILTAPRAYSSAEAIESSPAVAVGATPPPPPSPPPPPPPPPQKLPEPEEVINSWELMAGLLDPSTPAKPRRRRIPLRPIDGNTATGAGDKGGGAVLYTTSLRALRPTFESCNAVRAALLAHGVAFRERDVSMDRGFKEELLRLLSPVEAKAAPLLPRLFVRGRHVGGADEVLRLDEEGKLAPLLEGLPKARGGTCDGCGGMRFLPCFDCSGSRKLAVPLLSNDRRKKPQSMVVRCRECNENGLVLCPICS
jgi:glutaredoxin domain-containing cysteine-rich protein 1